MKTPLPTLSRSLQQSTRKSSLSSGQHSMHMHTLGSACEPTADKVESTGVGIGGSGGAAKGWVAEVTVQGVGHLIPTEAVGETADPSVEWLGNEMAAWREKEIVERSEWAYIPDEQKRTISDQYIEALRGETKSDTARLSRL